ncbi:cupin [Tritrichomonas foetus]|uniref:Cupin n=1 Tax=Tritrichomonas foetus TaxID=1144522 RepID=A0A1J4J1P1_9EUKA|nr:cupin [Tritrichomonas foetus]|eukprot:OHS93322.1 cupin [Tritrichomonas foetus]
MSQEFIPTFPIGTEFKSPNFTGRVFLGYLVEKNDVFPNAMANVTFEPGCRNSWHSHPDGQILLCTDGEGYYQEKGKKIQLLQKGDVVKILPNVVHWHGATPTSWFSHIACGVDSTKGPAVWLDPVSDEDYKSYSP